MEVIRNGVELEITDSATLEAFVLWTGQGTFLLVPSLVPLPKGLFTPV